MSPDDERHGLRRGYYAHRRDGEEACDPCRRAAAAAEQRYQLFRSRGKHGRLDPTGTQRRLRALVALGYTWTSLDEHLGTCRAIEKVGNPDLEYVMPKTAATVAELYERLSMQLPPQNTAREKAAVTKARNQARRKGWAVPLAWNDIDDPNEEPRGWEYRPATRVDLVRELAAEGHGVSEVCRRLKMSRASLQKWCGRRDLSPLFRQLCEREDGMANERLHGGVA